MAPRPRRIAVFTGARAEYGLLSPIIAEIDRRREDLALALVVAGGHLADGTVAEIEADGYAIAAAVPIAPPDAGARTGTARAVAEGVLGLADAFERLAPDAVVIYGDRFEAFAAAIAASQMALPIAHVEGGDVTEGGALDDAVRHAITKLAQLHLTTNAEATARVIAMGEEPWRVSEIGLPALDRILAGDYAPADEVAARLGLDLEKPVVVFTQHSVTTEIDQAAAQIAPSIAALKALAAEGAQIVATHPNADAGGQVILAALEAAAAESPWMRLEKSLGRRLYHGALALARDPARRVVCAGNSSSGVKETAALDCPTVNIGSRQAGRLRAENVVDAPYDADAVAAALRTALYDEAFRARARAAKNPYGEGRAGPRAAAFLATVDLSPDVILRKNATPLGATQFGAGGPA